jgi:hypothetical protein
MREWLMVEHFNRTADFFIFEGNLTIGMVDRIIQKWILKICNTNFWYKCWTYFRKSNWFRQNNDDKVSTGTKEEIDLRRAI